MQDILENVSRLRAIAKEAVIAMVRKLRSLSKSIGGNIVVSNR